MKIAPSSLSTSTRTSTSTGAGASPWIRRPEENPLIALMFGKKPAKLVDRRKYPSLKKGMQKLDLSKSQIAEALGAPEAFFSVELAEGNNASINAKGQIAFGLELLDEHQNDNDLLVGILAHEIGHQPWSWPKEDLSKLTKKDLDLLYKEEEAKADRFAGKALAELGVDPDAVCRLLLAAQKFEAHPPSDYYPATVRAEMIKEAFNKRKAVLDRASHLSLRAQQRRRELR